MDIFHYSHKTWYACKFWLVHRGAVHLHWMTRSSLHRQRNQWQVRKADTLANGLRPPTLLLTACSSTTYWPLCDLARLKVLSECDYNQPLELAKAHFIPEQTVSVQRYTCRFNSWNHLRGETIATYVAELIQLADQWDFKDPLRDMLCDNLVCGMNDQVIQH